MKLLIYNFSSEITAEGRRITKLDQILLDGNNIAINHGQSRSSKQKLSLLK